MRLVDADPIEKWLLSHADQVPGKDPYKRARICAYRHAFEAVHSAPTVAAAYCYPAATQPPNDPVTWISVKEKLPENEEPVLACVEVRFLDRKPLRLVVLAFHTDGETDMEASSYCWDIGAVDMAYDEARDAYIVPEGWWESVRYTEEFAAVHDFVTHWIPLPAPPEATP